MPARDRMLAYAALAFGAGAVLRVGESVVRLVAVLGEPHRGETVIADSLQIIEYAVFALAAWFVARYFMGQERDRRGLRDAAVLLVAGYGFAVLAAAFLASADFAEPNFGFWRTAAVLDGFFLAGLLGAALLAAVGFSRDDREEGDRLLGFAALAFVTSNLVALGAGLLRSEAYTFANGYGLLTVGLNVGTVALLGAVVAGALAALAFLAEPWEWVEDETAQRNVLLGAAACSYVVFVALALIGTGIDVVANVDLRMSTARSAPIWIEVPAGLCELAAAACAAAAFLPAVAGLAEWFRDAWVTPEPDADI